MNQCSIMSCSDNKIYTGSKLKINRKNVLTISYTDELLGSETYCIACSNSEKILKSKIILVGQDEKRDYETVPYNQKPKDVQAKGYDNSPLVLMRDYKYNYRTLNGWECFQA